VFVFVSEVAIRHGLTAGYFEWVSNDRRVTEITRLPSEFAALIVGVGSSGYITFTTSENSSSPATCFISRALSPMVALRFGSLGVSTSVVVVTFLSIWGVIHGRGPFTGSGAIQQRVIGTTILVFAAAPPWFLQSL